MSRWLRRLALASVLLLAGCTSLFGPTMSVHDYTTNARLVDPPWSTWTEAHDLAGECAGVELPPARYWEADEVYTEEGNTTGLFVPPNNIVLRDPDARLEIGGKPWRTVRHEALHQAQLVLGTLGDGGRAANDDPLFDRCDTDEAIHLTS